VRATEPPSSSMKVHAGRFAVRGPEYDMASLQTAFTAVPSTVTSSSALPEEPRLTLKPRGRPTGQVDGAWWPRTRDLAAELPALISVVGARLGRVERVSYHLGDWDPTSRRITVDGALVRLTGYHAQHTDTIDLLGAGWRSTLLLVPARTHADAAQRAMTAAGRDGSTATVADLLNPRSGTADAGPEHRREGEGGHPR
jgi:hypothetical protein